MKYRSADSSAWPQMMSGVARLVDEDVVDLVDDGEAALALDPLLELRDHVVAQVVEPELVVRAVRDVGRVGLAAVDRAQVDQPLVVGRIAGLEEERRVVGDHPDAHPQEVEDRAHPLRVAAGQVVVDRDDVDAASGQRVEEAGDRGDEGLALAGPHLGDLALVEDRRAHQLDVEVAHPERPLHGLAGHREDLRRGLIEGLWMASFSRLRRSLRELAATLEVGVGELVLGRLAGRGEGPDLLADLGELAPDLVVGQALELVLEGVGLVDHRLESFELAVVRVDEAGEEAHGSGSIGRDRRASPSRGRRRPARIRARRRCPRTHRGAESAHVCPPARPKRACGHRRHAGVRDRPGLSAAGHEFRGRPAVCDVAPRRALIPPAGSTSSTARRPMGCGPTVAAPSRPIAGRSSTAPFAPSRDRVWTS